MKPIEHLVTPIAMQQVEPVRDRRRSYHAHECRSLFGEPALLIAWGRIGRPPRTRLETFSDRTVLLTRLRELRARRLAHGYR